MSSPESASRYQYESRGYASGHGGRNGSREDSGDSLPETHQSTLRMERRGQMRAERRDNPIMLHTRQRSRTTSRDLESTSSLTESQSTPLTEEEAPLMPLHLMEPARRQEIVILQEITAIMMARVFLHQVPRGFALTTHDIAMRIHDRASGWERTEKDRVRSVTRDV